MPELKAKGLKSCLLCGHRFDPDSAGCKPSCPLSGGCGLLCCPRCGHGSVQEDRGLAGLIKQALVRLGKPS
jgi:hypothetical protein